MICLKTFIFSVLILWSIVSTKQDLGLQTIDTVLSKGRNRFSQLPKNKNKLNNSYKEIPGIHPIKWNHSKRSAEDRVAPKKFESLCDNPYIYAADRLINNTVRVYRDEYYWDLIGIPDRRVNVRGPFHNWFNNMNNNDVRTAIQTVTSGHLIGVTFKYRLNRYWSWHPTGKQRSGGRAGDKWDLIPDSGFIAAYNDGDLDGKGFSQMIAFDDIYVYYFNTNGTLFRRIGDEKGYLRGKDGEMFPVDLNAAFAFPQEDNSTNYLVYLFKMDKHCVRTHLNVDGCPEWRENRELFGCRKKTPVMSTVITIEASKSTEQTKVEEAVGSMANHSIELNFLLFNLCLASILLKFI